MTYRQLLFRIGFHLILLGTGIVCLGGVKDDIGWTALQTELGGVMPLGVGIGISQVEALVGTDYAADAADPELSGKTITLKSGASGASGHATFVARNYCGITSGVAPGITQIDAYEVSLWVQTGFLHAGNSGAAPNIESRRVENHSWIGNFGSQSLDEEVLRRFDYSIQRDGFVAIVGLNNGSANPLPELMSQSYNSISIGVPNGNHSAGLTTNDVAGRIKPEIVVSSAYGDTVSYACGVVSGAAALLLQKADATPTLVNARTNSEVIKALLLAGATKSQFPGWARTSTQPIDLVYGAGQLNVQNSYHLLVAGEQASSSSVTLSNRGWDFATTTASSVRYFFDVPAGYALTNFSVILTWNRKITGSNPGRGFTWAATVADLNLRLYNATGFTLGTQLDGSLSTIQNVEHIFTNTLPAGRYVLEVSSDSPSTDYALAWGGTLQAQIFTSVNQVGWGTVNPPPGNYTLGTPMTFIATPATYFLFSNWSGNLSGTNSSILLTVNSNMTVAAAFKEKFTTNHPTPYWWLGSYGYTSNQESVITNLGANGFPLWQSYIAGLVPTNPASQLKFVSHFLLQKTNLVMNWNTVTGRLYTIWSSTNELIHYAPQAGASNLPATVQAFTNQISPESLRTFYRLDAHLP